MARAAVDAILCWTTALENNFPRPSTLYNHRGWAHERMGNMLLAMQDYTAATMCDGFFTMGLENRARLKGNHRRLFAARSFKMC